MDLAGYFISHINTKSLYVWNLQIHYHVHNSLPLNPTQSQMNPVSSLKFF